MSTPPIITEFQCYQKIVAAKKPQSAVPGDLPSPVLKEFSVELAKPLSNLLNKDTQSANWPKQRKVEYTTPIGKIPSQKVKMILGQLP